jgi:transcriptional regulator with XRE-family HTH domain
LLAEARRVAGMSQDELARRAHTSRPTLSAYEHGRKSPTLETAARLLAEAGFELTVQPHVAFTPGHYTRANSRSTDRSATPTIGSGARYGGLAGALELVGSPTAV